MEFVCKARTSATSDPQDCDWPICGCDPYANKVIAALEERGDNFVSDLETITDLLRGFSKLRVSTVAADARSMGRIDEWHRCVELIEDRASEALRDRNPALHGALVRLSREIKAP